MSFVGRGRIVAEERTEFCGVRVMWHVVLFVDDAVGSEREVGRSMDASHANAIKTRWEKETCAKFDDAPVKYSSSGLKSAQNRKKPPGHDLRGTSRMMRGKVLNASSVTPSD